MVQKFILEHTCDDVINSKNPKTTTTSVSTYKCIRCAKDFEEEDALICHQNSVCLAKFICHICKRVCINQKRLNVHERVHQTRIYICDECGYSANSEHELMRHKVCHSTERNVKCPLCPAIFNNNHLLTLHQNIHIDRKYECHYCGKKFRTLDTVKSHLATHVHNEYMRKYSCEVCEKTFVRKRDRERHLRIHTGKDQLKVVLDLFKFDFSILDERPIKCEICFKEFRDTGLKNEHFRRVHEGQYYECKHCNKCFSNRGQLKEHFFVHRDFSPYNCAACPQKFVRKYK
jgi:KRAB domain-containing zinc finger protein